MPVQKATFQTHLALAHQYWHSVVRPGDSVIDATCGNGHDTLVLAQLALTDSSGAVFGFDIQEKAIQSTRTRLASHLSPEKLNRVCLTQGSHEYFLEELAMGSISLVVYNLGYLPGADKNLTTNSTTTLRSIEKAFSLIRPTGLISITCYPGHPAGEEEEKLLLAKVAELNKVEWTCCHHRWVNRQKAPSLLLIQKNEVRGQQSESI